MSIVHHIVIIIIALAFFDYIMSDCINGTSEGCSDGTICFLNMCYPSSGACSNGQCGDGFICVNQTCLNISAPTTSATKTATVTTITTATETTTTTEATTTAATTTTTTTTTATTITTTPQCVDRSRPGQASDCPRVKHLCENPLYYRLMTEQCPLTCGRCPGTDLKPKPTSQACFDRTGADGISNCATVSYLCQSILYRQLMIAQCPRTCGYC